MIFIAWKNLLHDKMRFIISVLGISLAILLLFAIKGIAVGIKDSIVKYAYNQDADLYIMQRGVENMQMATSFFPAAVLEQIKRVDGVKEAEGIYGLNYQYEKKGLKIASYLVGYKKLGGPWNIEEGKKNPEKDEIIVDYAFAQKGGFKLGDSINMIGHTFKIVGISRETNPMGGLFLFTDKDTMDNVLKNKDSLNIIIVKAKDGVNINALKDEINKIPIVNAITKDKLAKNEQEMVAQLFDPIINSIVFLVVLVSTAFIGLTIYNATLEKIEEYTILKAIGARKFQLFIIVFFQSFSIALFGTIIGFLLSYLVSYLAYILMPDITVTATLSLGISYFWIVPTMALLSSYIPLQRIYKIDEADVLRN